MSRAFVTGPALNVRDAAAYIGWAHESLRTKWRRYPLLVAAAVKVGGHLVFLQPRLDAFLAAHRVAVQS